MGKRNTYFQDEEVQRKIDIRQLGRVLRYVLPYRHIFVFVLVLMLVSSVASMLTPLLLKHLINDVVTGSEYGPLILVVAEMTMLAALEIVVTFLHQRLMGKMGHNIIAGIRQEIFYKLQELPFDYFDSKPDGKIVVRVTNYINDLADFFTNTLLQLLTYIIKLIVVTFFMIGNSLALTGAVMAAVIPMMGTVFYLRFKIRQLFAGHRAKIANRTAFLVEVIMGEKIIKTYNRTEECVKTYHEVHDASLKQWMRIVRRNELNTPVVEIFWNLGMLALYGLSLDRMLQGDPVMTAGLVITFVNYMNQFSGPLTQIAVIIQRLAQVSSNLEQVFDTIDYPVEIENDKDSVAFSGVKGKVDFNDVSFEYEAGVPILEHFELHVSPGETIALVGPTGAGKTTVINMITRFYDVKTGSVMIDNVDVRKVTLHSLRSEVGVLMQDPFIFKGTVMDNIRYGRVDASDEECIAAAKRIYAHDFIMQLSGGYQHELEERGGTLSAGQKQLISFARIILKNPSVVILDEATSSIDTETEALIKEALDVILKDKTAFIVAHRISTIRNADRILYISDKGIAEEGTHEQLMQKQGLYYALN